MGAVDRRVARDHAELRQIAMAWDITVWRERCRRSLVGVMMPSRRSASGSPRRCARSSDVAGGIPDAVERATKVAAAYRPLVAKTREVAGGYMRYAWDRDPITTDSELSTGGASTSPGLDESETAYLDAVEADLKWHRFWR